MSARRQFDTVQYVFPSSGYVLILYYIILFEKRHRIITITIMITITTVIMIIVYYYVDGQKASRRVRAFTVYIVGGFRW